MANPPAGQASAWTSRLTRSSTPIQDRGPWVGRGNVARGLVPRWGRGGAWQNPPRQYAVPSHSCFFIPWCAGTSQHERSLRK